MLKRYRTALVIAQKKKKISKELQSSHNQPTQLAWATSSLLNYTATMSAHTVKRRKLSPSRENDSVDVGGNVPKPTTVEPAQNGVRRDEHPAKSSMNHRGKDERSAELAMASGFYKSSFFKLQMDELLTGLRPNYEKRVSNLQDTLHKVKSAIETLPETTPKSVAEAEKELRTAGGIVIPWPEPRPNKDAKYTMSYSKPTSINVVGSFALRTGAKTAEHRPVDLAVTMPSSLFQYKDYVNYRYFHKRAYYVACLAAGIQESMNALDLDVKFGLQDGDSLRPLIVLEPRPASKEKEASVRPHIRIITAIEHSLFPITRTLPTKSNIRQGSSADSAEIGEPTPLYNASLRSETTVSLYHKDLHSATQRCESFRDASILGRIWQQQRGFNTSFQGGGFGGFEWAALMSLLFESGGPTGQPVLLPSYSSYQIFKATIQFLAGKDLTNPLLLFATDVFSPGSSSGRGPVVYDGRRGLNILYKMTPWSYAALRHEASTTLRMLNESREDNFDKVFIVKVDEPALKFDRLVAFPKSFSGDSLRALREQTALYDVLSRAFGNRVKLISMSSRCVDSWSIRSKALTKKASEDLSVGLLLDSENAMRLVDHGPPAEKKDDAASFRSFWGEKAELRRFKDGSILESLVWSDQPSEKSIVHRILTYILQRHFKITESDFEFIGDEFDEKIRSEGDGIVAYSSPAFQVINNAFDDLERSIRNMDDVPLEVRHLGPASPLLRHTALRVQSPGETADVVLQFESSSRWPDDFAAIQMTKVAFLIKIGDSLESSGTASSCRVGLENKSSRVLNNAFLDIQHTSGFVFRLRIHHDRELTLLERQRKDKSISPREREEVAYALFAYKKLFVQTPRLTQALRILCTRFPLLSPTIRLVKQWFYSHLFSAQINDELIELLTTRTFTQPSPWNSPSSVMTGFLRTLHSLSRWDWQQEPFTVDLGGELNAEVTETIRTRFTAWRNIDPAMNTVALFVASDVDPDGVTWTQYERPSKVVAARMSTLAKAAVNLVRKNCYELNVSDLFHTSLAPYDFVVHLRPKAFDRSAFLKFKNLAESGDHAGKMALVKSFVQDVQSCYSQSILLFHGDERCNLIAGLWNPQTLKPKSWTLKTAYSTAPRSWTDSSEKHDDHVVINQPAILNEIARLGNGLVDKIEVKETNGQA